MSPGRAVKGAGERASAVSDVYRKLGGYFSVSDQLKSDLDALHRERFDLAQGKALIRVGDPYSDIYLLEKGWMLRARHMPDGGRQIVNVGLPGDFLCYNTLMFERSQFDLVA